MQMGLTLHTPDFGTKSADGLGSSYSDSIETDATFLEPIGESAIGRTADKGLARIHPRLQAMMLAARYHGIELNPAEFPRSEGGQPPAPAALSQWAHHAGMWARAVRLRWRHLMRLQNGAPVVVLLNDGGAGLLTGVNPEQQVVYLRDPAAPADVPPVAVDELRMSQVWAGEAVLLRAARGHVTADAPFNLRWLADLVL